MATPEHEAEYLNDERLEDERRLWRAGLSQAEVDTRMRAEAAEVSEAEKARRIAEWRGKYPGATCSDFVAWLLIGMADLAGREP